VAATRRTRAEGPKSLLYRKMVAIARDQAERCQALDADAIAIGDLGFPARAEGLVQQGFDRVGIGVVLEGDKVHQAGSETGSDKDDPPVRGARRLSLSAGLPLPTSRHDGTGRGGRVARSFVVVVGSEGS